MNIFKFYNILNNNSSMIYKYVLFDLHTHTIYLCYSIYANEVSPKRLGFIPIQLKKNMPIFYFYFYKFIFRI